MSQVQAPDYFEGLALGRDPSGNAVVTYGRTRTLFNRLLADIWVRRVSATSSFLSSETKLAIVPPLVDQFAYFPAGATLYEDGRAALGYEQCDALTLGGVCGDLGLAWVGRDASFLGSRSTWPQTLFLGGPIDSFSSDALGNPAVVGLNQLHDMPTITFGNPVASVVATVTLNNGQLPAVDESLSRRLVGLVSLASGQTAVLWYTGDWVHFQALSVPHDGTAAPFFHTVDPCRIVDTRGTNTPMVAGEDRVIKATETCGIPVGAKALSANAVAVSPGSAGNFSFYRPDRVAPEASALNYKAGDIRAGSIVLPLDATGALAVRATQASGSTHLILDVGGYFE